MTAEMKTCLAAQIACIAVAFLASCCMGAEQSAFSGVYTIVHKGSGRRISARTDVGFAVINASEPILRADLWKLSEQPDNQGYAIVNVENGVRIVAKNDADWERGFFAIAGGPDSYVYQDQKWLLYQHVDGSYVILNFKSGRRMLARSSLVSDTGGAMPTIPASGHDGFSATAHEWPVYDDQLWWLINQERDESALKALAFRGERDEKGRTADELMAEASRLSLMLDAGQATLSRLLFAIATAAVIVLSIILACWRSKVRFARAEVAQRKRADLLEKELRRELGCDDTVEAEQLLKSEQEQLLDSSAADFSCQVLTTAEVENEGETRLIKIQCPGVEHDDVEVELIFNGCIVSIRRRAAPGVEALTWKKRFRFRASEGLFEFKEDQMQLDRGFLKLVFQAYTFQTRLIRFPQYFNMEDDDDDVALEYPDYDEDDDIKCFDDMPVGSGSCKVKRRRSWGGGDDTESTAASTTARRRSWGGATETDESIDTD